MPFFNEKGTEYFFRPTFKEGSLISHGAVLSEVLVLSRTLEVMKAHYDALMISEILADDAKLSLYFHQPKGGRDMLLTKYLGLNNTFVTHDELAGDNDDDF